jgi:hypothetical protein
MNLQSTQYNYLASSMSGSMSGIIEVLVSHPFDRIKTSMQIFSLNKTRSDLLYTIIHIYKSNGIRGFYNGIIPRIGGIIPMRLTYWGTMRTTSSMTKSLILPGIIAGLAQSIIDNPIEVLKIKLMTKTKQKNIINVNYVYKGFVPLVFRNILFAIPVSYSVKKYGTDHPFLAGAIGGLIGSIISHPFDLIKTEIQRYPTQKIHMYDVLKKISNNESIYSLNTIKKLSSGLIMRCGMGCLNMGIGFYTFDHIYLFCLGNI